jgi:hypothetical protein
MLSFSKFYHLVLFDPTFDPFRAMSELWEIGKNLSRVESIDSEQQRAASAAPTSTAFSEHSEADSVQTAQAILKNNVDLKWANEKLLKDNPTLKARSTSCLTFFIRLG